MKRNIPASIKARLLHRSKDSHEEFELFLVRYEDVAVRGVWDARGVGEKNVHRHDGRDVGAVGREIIVSYS